MREHGLGLKISGKIAEKINGMCKTSAEDGIYETKTAISLSTPMQTDTITV